MQQLLARWLYGPPTDGREVIVHDDPVVVPSICACCCEPASVSRRETRRRDGQTVIVPYCSTCLKHASSPSTHVLSVSLASGLLGTAATVGLPLAWPELPLIGVVLLAVVLGSLPLVFAAVWRRPLVPGHVARNRAVWWTPSGRLFCVAPRFASELAKASSLESAPAVGREPKLSPWMAVGAVVALVASPTLYYIHHPRLRIVNLSEHRVVVLVDDRAVADLAPSSAESPAAGVEVRIPSGRREIRAEASTGAVVHSASVDVESGAAHLYAPGADGICFWLETTAYGRHGRDRTLAPLTTEKRFWVLSEGVDTWFAPNPLPEEKDARSSGGTLTALRQAPCVQAPNAVRRSSTLHR